jgi:multiple sugar transport system substrate-binding protein
MPAARPGPAPSGVPRRAVLAGLLPALVAPGVLAACAGPGGASPPPGGGSPPALSGTVTWMHNTNGQVTGFDQVADAFRARLPALKLEVVQATDQYDDKLLATFAAGNPPDVLRQNDDYVLSYKTKNLIAPLDGYVKSAGLKRDDIHPAVWDFPIHDGKMWAWSMGANARMLFYNVDLFRNAGVPLPPSRWSATGWTFDDFLDTAKRLTNPNATPESVFGCSVYDDSGYEQTLSVNNGSPSGIYSKDGRQFTLADPPGYEMMQWVADLHLKHRVMPHRTVVTERRSVAAMFANQQVGMRWTNTSNLKQMQKDNQFTWDVAPMPMRVKRMQEGVMQVFSLAVGARNPDAGWRLLQFFVEEEAAKILVDTGYVLPAKKVFGTDYVDALKGKPPANAALILEAFEYQMQTNQVLDVLAARAIYRGAGNSNLNQIWDGNVTARDWLTGVRAQVEASIAPR